MPSMPQRGLTSRPFGGIGNILGDLLARRFLGQLVGSFRKLACAVPAPLVGLTFHLLVSPTRAVNPITAARCGALAQQVPFNGR